MTTERDLRKYITYAREEGRIEGAKNQARETAKALMGMCVSEDIIEKSTGLTREEIRELQR